MKHALPVDFSLFFTSVASSRVEFVAGHTWTNAKGMEAVYRGLALHARARH